MIVRIKFGLLCIYRKVSDIQQSRQYDVNLPTVEETSSGIYMSSVAAAGACSLAMIL